MEKHHAIEGDEGVTLRLSVLTALQLYSDGILTADAKKPVELSIAGRSREAYYLHWMRAIPGHEFGNPVVLRFGPKPAKQEPKFDPNAWLPEQPGQSENSLAPVMREGRWKSVRMLMRYGEHAMAARGEMARAAREKGREGE